MFLLLSAILSIGLGVGFLSLISFYSLILNGTLTQGFILFDIVIVFLLTFFVYGVLIASCKYFHGSLQQSPSWLLCVSFGFALLYGIIVLICLSLDSQHGNWDAWAIWNMRARFLFRGGEYWQDAFSHLMHWSHPDYPLLLPSAIARIWLLISSESTFVPITIAIGFSLCTVGLLTLSVALFRGWSSGFLAGLILLGTPYFLVCSASQYADIPVGFYYLATLFLLSIAFERAERWRLMLLAGMMAGCAGWTKNEGLLFIIAVVLVYGGVQFFSGERRKVLKDMLWFFGGLAPFLFAIVYFKLNLAPSNDIIAGQGVGITLERLIDPSRYFIVGRAFVGQLVRFGNGVLLVLLVFVWLNRKKFIPSKSMCIAGGVLLLMFLGFFFVYITTPRDLYFHLGNSLDRLLLQLWPSCLFVLFVLINSSHTEKEYQR